MKQIRKPNFFIAGAVKGGTTALWTYLNQHPDVFLSVLKEPHYFFKDFQADIIRDDFQEKVNSNKAVHQRFVTEEKDYLALFEKAGDEKAVGEASASYLFSTLAAEEIYTFNPDSKIIISLRNPIERAFSHYLMNLRMGFSTKAFIDDFMEDVKKEKKAWGLSHLYLELGLYASQIQKFIRVFGKEKVLVLLHENLSKQTQVELTRITDFLEIAPFDFDLSQRPNEAKMPKNRKLNKLLGKFKAITPDFVLKRAKGLLFDKGNLPVLSKEEYQKLLPFFKDDILQLEQLLNLKLNSWYHE